MHLHTRLPIGDTGTETKTAFTGSQVNVPVAALTPTVWSANGV